MTARYRPIWASAVRCAESPHIGLVLAVCIFGSTAALAQAPPWTVTITPTLSPLPVGFCSAVQLTVADAAANDVPRNPLGFRVSMADFDMAATGAAVVGDRIDATHFQVCACQGGTADSVAEITATYPARTLAPSARVSRVEFQTTARVVLAPPKGAVDPPACLAAVDGAARQTPGVTGVPRAAPTGPSAPAAPLQGLSPLPGTATGRPPPYVAGPVTATLALSANGSWYEPGAVTASFGLSAQGAWYEPAPVTVTFGLSATGNWNERTASPAGRLQPAPPRP